MSVPRYRTTLFFNGFSSFKAAFPELYDASIEWEELEGPEDPGKPKTQRAGFRKGNLNVGLLRCSNPDCHEGGYLVDRLIQSLMSDGDTERGGTLYCGGRELTEEARRATRCRHRISYRISLMKREEPAVVAAPSRRRNRGRRHRSSAAVQQRGSQG